MNLLRSLFLFLWILGAAYSLSAQPSQKYTLSKGATAIRFNALGILDLVETNASFGVAYSFKPLWAVALDAAWVFRSSYLAHKQNANGFVVRPSVRKYNKGNSGMYYEVELHYKYMYFGMQDWLGKECVQEVPSYEQYTRFGIIRQTAGMHMKTGVERSISKDGKLWIDIYGGLGVRTVWYRVYHQPNSCYEFERIFPAENNKATQVLPAVPMGVRLVYRIK